MKISAIHPVLIGKMMMDILAVPAFSDHALDYARQVILFKALIIIFNALNLINLYIYMIHKRNKQYFLTA
jgi:hypothetical protein